MAERRMFAKTITNSDSFLDMPLSTQALYFHLNMNADDDGFINRPKSLMRMIGCSEDDMRLLLAKSFLIPFESGVVVIKHWRINNYIQKDRYKTTNYEEEFKRLSLKENGAYTLENSECIQLVYNSDTQVRLGKDSIGKDIKEISKDTKKKFIKPTVDDVAAYCSERNNKIDPQAFIDFYESKGWLVGKTPMKDWKAAVRNWERLRYNEPNRNNREPIDKGNEYAKSFKERLMSGEFFEEL